MIFENRDHAGKLLALKLHEFKNSNAVLFALARGGIPVAAEIAKSLRIPIDVLLVRKIGVPFHQELAIGAICEDGEPFWNASLLSHLGLEPDDMGPSVTVERSKIHEQSKIFRNGHELSGIAQKTVIVVDDGLATGATMIAATKYLKAKGASKIIIAVPVAATEAVKRLKEIAGDVVTVEESASLSSVGEWYRDFSQISNQEALFLIEEINNQDAPTEIEIAVDKVKLNGDLTTVADMKSMIVFAHGSGSSRKSPRNRQVAKYLNTCGFGTLLFDLLTEKEAKSRENVFDIQLLSERLILVTRWLHSQPKLQNIKIGYFGASTGAGAAILAASKLLENEKVYAIVSRGGRPDLAMEALEALSVPILLLVGSYDYEVIDHNRLAQQKLANSELSIIQGATHLFEEPGTLENVAIQASEWFDEHLASGQEEIASTKIKDLEEAIEEAMVPFTKEEGLEELIYAIKDSPIVMLGESSHGTEDFYRIRRIISQKLIQEHGFNFIAVEGDWPDIYRLNKYIQSGEGKSARDVLIRYHRWPTWMWANEEIVKLAEWMRAKNAHFYGLDVYSLFDSIQEVVSFLNKNYPELAKKFAHRYSCFDPYEGDEVSYARSLISYPPGCEDEVVKNLQEILKLKFEDNKKDGDELFSSQQNAHIIADAESYYRAMLRGDATSWNVRDTHMMDTLERLIEKADFKAKAIVWAHNTHIGDYRATDMLASGYVNLGGLAREVFGEENVSLVGFGTYQGKVLASSAWGGAEKTMSLPPSPEESYEHYFHKVAQKTKQSQYYILLEDESHSPFAQIHGHRAVGVVYDPRHEHRGNYVPTQLSKRYDAFIFVDKTQALKSLHSSFVKGEFPETWPTGQ